MFSEKAEENRSNSFAVTRKEEEFGVAFLLALLKLVNKAVHYLKDFGDSSLVESLVSKFDKVHLIVFGFKEQATF